MSFNKIFHPVPHKFPENFAQMFNKLKKERSTVNVLFFLALSVYNLNYKLLINNGVLLYLFLNYNSMNFIRIIVFYFSALTSEMWTDLLRWQFTRYVIKQNTIFTQKMFFYINLLITKFHKWYIFMQIFTHFLF